jgi:hypothetical protein
MKGESLKKGCIHNRSFQVSRQSIRFFPGYIDRTLFWRDPLCRRPLCVSFVCHLICCGCWWCNKQPFLHPCSLSLKPNSLKEFPGDLPTRPLRLQSSQHCCFLSTLLLAPIGIMRFISNSTPKKKIQANLVILRHFRLILFLMALIEFLKTLLQSLGIGLIVVKRSNYLGADYCTDA